MSHPMALQTFGWLAGGSSLALVTDGLLSSRYVTATLPVQRSSAQVTMKFTSGARPYRFLLPPTPTSFLLRRDAHIRASVEVALALGKDDLYERLAAYVGEAILRGNLDDDGA